MPQMVKLYSLSRRDTSGLLLRMFPVIALPCFASDPPVGIGSDSERKISARRLHLSDKPNAETTSPKGRRRSSRACSTLTYARSYLPAGPTAAGCGKLALKRDQLAITTTVCASTGSPSLGALRINLIVYSPAAVAQNRNTWTIFSPYEPLFLGFSRQLPRNSTPLTSGDSRQKYLVLESDLRRTVNSLSTATMMVSNFTQSPS
jgi:hypothetical protein